MTYFPADSPEEDDHAMSTLLIASVLAQDRIISEQCCPDLARLCLLSSGGRDDLGHLSFSVLPLLISIARSELKPILRLFILTRQINISTMLITLWSNDLIKVNLSLHNSPVLWSTITYLQINPSCM